MNGVIFIKCKIFFVSSIELCAFRKSRFCGSVVNMRCHGYKGLSFYHGCWERLLYRLGITIPIPYTTITPFPQIWTSTPQNNHLNWLIHWGKNCDQKTWQCDRAILMHSSSHLYRLSASLKNHFMRTTSKNCL